ncbi:dihydrofolate reductase family protein [Oceanotoga sp. DSM 15011]|jgi:riboflavin biosynthesis pyrimidine reductase|uniref:Riboflavin biosynthesis pyrimidine reductase n=1 Tax=Oceanotoga teriensis TaxID=515440 RepID=A0AA45HHL5_9BACT|nr:MULTISPECIES: dihydrofolate reductase family protein [Oceanotoga]MDN5341889.1 hypothetical protein [Oceanotoga sp.]PWJ86118.1 riboflavin biosynthesis pyrimidine reductase [Oceanotoga teriensis]UYP00723.1 dihydrofolate reductase family protein [Oceanotoga sp. DSM 15011]
MATKLEKMLMLEKDIKLNKIYESNDLKDFSLKIMNCEKINKVYGNLTFEKAHEDRPYTFTSLVTSIDGRIAFSDAPQGPLISRKNNYAGNGGLADWWILNMLRSVCDAVILGAGTMKAESDYTCHVFDQDLENARIKNNLNPVPWNIITSIDGKDIPFDHRMFKESEIPLIISSSSKALNHIKENINNDYIVIGPLNSKEDINNTLIEKMNNSKNKVIIIITGKNAPDSHVLFYLLKKFGIDRLLIETPSYMHYLVSEKLMDELFFNYSCLYIGGKALTIGQYGKEFTSECHPHTKMLSIHSHNDHFFYFRHRLIYN